ncbi:hypothetical protein TNCV_517541 [Trichonephila clavipes]|nr:hypothetical protein TNCV_517541 [Trichonephila clavipes]
MEDYTLWENGDTGTHSVVSCDNRTFVVDHCSEQISSVMKSMLVCLLALALLTTCYGFAITIKCYKNPDGTNHCDKKIDYYNEFTKYNERITMVRNLILISGTRRSTPAL